MSTEAHAAHHTSYVKIWFILLVLLCVSVAGPFLGIFWVTLITAFGIAIVKAYMVAKYFMHIDVQPKFVAFFLVTTLAFMGLFWAGVAPDIMNHEGTNWSNESAKLETKLGLEKQHAAAAGGHGEHGGGEHH
jgi:caa(3)-type oxidase subunit IV